MKQCSQCSWELPESATICESCGHPTDDLLTPALDSGAGSPSTHALSQGTVSALGRREMMAIVIALVLGGTVTLALLKASGRNSPEGAGARETASRSSPATPAPVTRPTWSSANRDWVGNQRNAVAFELLADSKVQIWQRHAQPILVVRCVSKRTETFVFIESAAQIEPRGKHTVRVRVDDDLEMTERWPDSDDHDALFAPDGAGFAQRLTRARTLRFGYTPHNAERVVAEFNVSGLSALIEPVAKQCGWQP